MAVTTGTAALIAAGTMAVAAGGTAAYSAREQRKAGSRASELQEAALRGMEPAQAAQTQLLNLQRELEEERMNLGELIMEPLLAEYGVTVQKDDSGRTFGFSTDEGAFGFTLDDLLAQAGGRLKSALGEEVPFEEAHPDVARLQEEERLSLGQTFREQIGPGYASSTPFLEAQERLLRKQGDVRRTTSESDIALSSGLMTNLQSLQNIFTGSVSGLTELPFRGAESLSQIAAGFTPQIQAGVQQAGLGLQQFGFEQQTDIARQRLMSDVFFGGAQFLTTPYSPTGETPLSYAVGGGAQQQPSQYIYGGRAYPSPQPPPGGAAFQ